MNVRDTHTRPSAEWLKELRNQVVRELAEFGDPLACGDADKLLLLDEIDCLNEEIAELKDKAMS